jgi:hypothetical protein
VRRYELALTLPPGNDGVLVTARRMAEIIRTQSKTFGFVRAWRDEEPGTDSFIERCLYWCREHFVYTFDPPGWDRYLTPDVHLDEILRTGRTVGDCDDACVLLGGCLWAGQVPQKLVLISREPDQELSHVYLRVCTSCGWLPVDPIQPWPVGVEPVDTTLVVEVPV